jgi:hypothetical protein
MSVEETEAGSFTVESHFKKDILLPRTLFLFDKTLSEKIKKNGKL